MAIGFGYAGVLGMKTTAIPNQMSGEEIKRKLAWLAEKDGVEIRIKYNNEWTSCGVLDTAEDYLAVGIVVLVGRELQADRIEAATDVAILNRCAMPLSAPDEWYADFRLPILIDSIQLIEETKGA